jgi:hypothetical protein
MATTAHSVHVHAFDGHETLDGAADAQAFAASGLGAAAGVCSGAI